MGSNTSIPAKYDVQANGCLSAFIVLTTVAIVARGVSRRILPGVMDPAMTAANATHNMCLILLHEKIACPDRRLSWVQIPSTSSADTCESAAIEICTIIGKILGQRGANYPLSPQLGLCAFVSARTLLCKLSATRVFIDRVR